MTKAVDKKRIQRPMKKAPSRKTKAKQLDGVIIQVTQAFCAQGHNLVHNDKALFDGAPGISLWVSNGKTEGEVILSPYHGDHRRLGLDKFKVGDKLTVACSVCKQPLERLSACSCDQKGDLRKIYLTEDHRDEHVVGLCDIWGCHRSHVYDQAQLLAIYQQD